MATINVTTTRPVNGGTGDDLMTGNGIANVISGGSGNDTLSGFGGDDVLKGDAGRDLLDGGAGNDRVDGNADDDVLVYVASENVGAEDEYNGGAGIDALRLVLTREEWMRPEVQSDIARFLAFIDSHTNPSGQATGETFEFRAFKLHAGMFERLEVTVDGVALDPRDEAVTAVADTAQTDENGSASGAVLSNDAVPDLVRSVEVIAQPAHGALTFNADGTYVYTPDAYFDALAIGETETDTFQYRVTDADGDTGTALVTVTMTGTNDGPVITNTAAARVGAVQEDGSLLATGQLSATDVDHNATQTWSVEGAADGAYGAIAVDHTGKWTYTLANDAHQDLAQGESHDEVFTVRVTDDQGAYVDQTVTVTVTGTNDTPVITNAAAARVGDVEEDTQLTVSGQLSATDVDHGATQTWSVEGAADGAYGAIAVDHTGKWTYTLASDAHQDLAQGESHDEVFTVRVTDDQGAYVDQTVTVRVAGTNDGPVITGGATTGTVAEDGVSQASGRLDVVDPDHDAQQIWTVVGGTPSGNADFHFRMDSLTVTKNNALFFRDDFADGNPPPSAPGGFSYGGVGVGDLSESNGKLYFDSENAVPFVGVGTPDPFVGQNAILRSNIDPASNGGLKSNSSFTVSGVFDLIMPDSARENYGIRLTDRVVGGNGTPPDQLGDNVVDLRVHERTDGTVVVRLRELNFVADTATTLQAIVLAPPPGADQIRLNLAHSAANVGDVTASIEYLSNGVTVGSQAFGAVGHIFQGENWTRAEVIASAPAMNDSQLGGTYGQLTVDQAGAWTYDLDNTRAVTQALAAGQHATDVFTVQVQDGFGAFDTRTISVDVVGSNDAPIMQTGSVARALAEDTAVTAGKLSAFGEGQFSDVDLTDTHAMSAAVVSATLSNGAALSAALATALDNAVAVALLEPSTGDGHAQYRWDFALDNAAAQFLAAGQMLTVVYDVVATDVNGAAATQQVTITIAGKNDVPVVATVDVTAAVTEAIAPVGTLTDSGVIAFSDADLADVHGVSAVTPSMGALGTLMATVTSDTTGSGTGGVVAWNYSVNAAALESLAAGQAKNESFAFSVLDGHGGSVARTVGVTLTGTNDAPVVTAQDTAGAVTALPTQPDAPPAPLVFTVQQYLGFQSNNLGTLRNYVATHAASYTAQTNVVDYTDDPGGFAGELPGSSRWPAAEAQNVVGTGGINNVFFARITADFSVSAADTYTFRTFNDDGVFLLVDNQLIINDTGYHPEIPFNGSIALQPGNHTIELFFFENGGEASLEFSVKNSTGSFGLVGASGGGLSGAQVQVSDSGTIAFADVDLTDVHLVSAAPVGGTLGSLAVVKNTDTTGSGTGGQLTWTYTVQNSAIAHLAAGETKVESFTVTLNDQHGGVVTRQIDVTVSGTNDVPVVAAADVAGAVAEMAVASGNLTDSGTIAFTDADLTDVHGIGAITPSAGALGTLTANVTTDTTGSGTGGVVSWNYSVAAAAVEYLAAGQTKAETFAFDVLDGHGGTVARTVSVTIAGANDGPAIVAPQLVVASTSFEEVAAGDPHVSGLAGGVWHTNNGGGLVEVNPGGVYGLTNNTSKVIELERTTFDASDLYVDIAATAGQSLRLEFDYAARAGTPTSGIDVYWGPNLVAHLSTTSQTMQHYTYAVSAPTTGSYRLEFQAQSDADGGGGLIDNISLSKLYAVTELGTPVGNLTTNGTLAFSDVDLADVHTVAASAMGSVLGSLSAVVSPDATGSGNGQIAWTYSVAASAVEYLAGGELKVESFNVALADGHGGIATQQVDITLIGTPA